MPLNESLRDFVERHELAQPILPIMHCCDLSAAISIAEEGKISPSICKYYSESLLYFFYGKSNYVPNEKLQPSRILGYFPVVFILSFDADESVKRVIGLDSGALCEGLFSDYFHKSTDRECLVAGNLISSAAKAVNAFYGNNERYLEDKVLPEFSAGKSMIANELRYLMGAQEVSAFDRRNSVIEIQSETSIDFSNGRLRHVVLPKDIEYENDLTNILENRWGASISFYRSPRIDPGRLATLAADKAADFIDSFLDSKVI